MRKLAASRFSPINSLLVRLTNSDDSAPDFPSKVSEKCSFSSLSASLPGLAPAVFAEELSAASADGTSASPLAAVAPNAIKCRRFIFLPFSLAN